jgi:hypothetical protein
MPALLLTVHGPAAVGATVALGGSLVGVTVTVGASVGEALGAGVLVGVGLRTPHASSAVSIADTTSKYLGFMLAPLDL